MGTLSAPQCLACLPCHVACWFVLRAVSTIVVQPESFHVVSTRPLKVPRAFERITVEMCFPSAVTVTRTGARRSKPEPETVKGERLATVTRGPVAAPALAAAAARTATVQMRILTLCIMPIRGESITNDGRP